MGCWNGTDSLTGLPIFWGDEIVLIPLIESYGVPSPSLCFDPDDNYSPLGLPIFGCYNDYGGTENIVEDKDNELFFKSLKLYELREGTEVSEDIISKAFKNTSTKTPVTIFRKIMDYAEKNKIEVSNFNEFLNDIVSSSDHFFVKVNQGIFKYSSIDYMMVHRELYERLVKEVGERYPYKEKKTYRELWKEKIVDIVNQKIEKDKELSKIEDPEVRETLFLMESFNEIKKEVPHL